MPCIQTKVNVTLTPEKEEAIKQKFGQAITAIPGKTENWLMCTFEDGCRMYFRGEAGAPMAFVEVKVYGKAPASAFDRLTGEITGILRDELDEKAWKKTLGAVFKDLYDRAHELGGQVSGEHGIGFAKKPYLAESLAPEVIALMRNIKLAFDPKNILNPGKVIE